MHSPHAVTYTGHTATHSQMERCCAGRTLYTTVRLCVHQMTAFKSTIDGHVREKGDQKEVIERLKLDVSGIRDQLELAEASQSHIILKKMAQHLDSRCVLAPAPKVWGQNTSRIQHKEV